MDEYIQQSIIDVERVILSQRARIRDYQSHVDFYAAQVFACEQTIREAEEFKAKMEGRVKP